MRLWIDLNWQDWIPLKSFFLFLFFFKLLLDLHCIFHAQKVMQSPSLTAPSTSMKEWTEYVEQLIIAYLLNGRSVVMIHSQRWRLACYDHFVYLDWFSWISQCHELDCQPLCGKISHPSHEHTREWRESNWG